MKRRSFMGSSFVAVTAALSGCVEELTSESGETAGVESQGADTDAAESMAEEYLEAVLTGDEETVSELRHDSLDIPPETNEVQDYEIYSVEQRSVETVASETEETVEELTSELDSIASEMGVDDYTFVAIDWEVQENGETEQVSEIIHVVYDDGDWFVGAPLAI